MTDDRRDTAGPELDPNRGLMNDDELRSALLAEVPERAADYWERIEQTLATATVDEPGTDRVVGIEDPIGDRSETPPPDIGVAPVEPLRSGRRRTLVFSAAAAVMLIGALLGGAFLAGRTSWSDGGADFAASGTEPGPGLGDHWHAIYGVWDCTLNDGSGDWVPKFDSTLDPDGIHSHGDGIIHIHPFFESAAHRNARLGLFAVAMGVELTDDRLVLDDGRVLSEAADRCAGDPATLQVRRWSSDQGALEGLAPTVITDGLADEFFRNDREVWVLAFAPLDAEIPLPPADRFQTLNQVVPADGSPPSPLQCDEAGNCTIDGFPVCAELDLGDPSGCLMAGSEPGVATRSCPPGFELDDQAAVCLRTVTVDD